MPYADPADKAANSARRYAERKEEVRRRTRRHRRQNPRLHAFWGQRHTAKQRGIEFKLTFEEWDDWWGDDFDQRGRKRNDLQMCRYGDEGAYELGNIYKATQAENDAGPRPRPEPDEGLHEDIPF